MKVEKYEDKYKVSATDKKGRNWAIITNDIEHGKKATQRTLDLIEKFGDECLDKDGDINPEYTV